MCQQPLLYREYIYSYLYCIENIDNTCWFVVPHYCNRAATEQQQLCITRHTRGLWYLTTATELQQSRNSSLSLVTLVVCGTSLVYEFKA